MAEEREQEAGSDETQNGGGGGIASSLLSKEIVIPALATAGAAVAYTALKSASSVKDKAEDEAGEMAENVGRRGVEGAKSGLGGGGGIGGMAGKLASKAVGGGGGGKAKKTRRLPIQRWTDVAVPVEVAYEKFTDFEKFPEFMHRVLRVEQDDDDTVQWEEKIWFSRREWKAEITDRRKNDRIAWKTTSGMAHAGLVSFHRLDDKLTRVLVTVDFVPQGMIEKMASGMRFVKRAVQADLARFKAYVEMGELEGVDYKARPAEQDAGDRAEDERSGGEQEERGQERNGSDPGEQEEERRGREERRQQRRKAAA